jgi:predicted neutral ceramidase superfamily lipid hydrolase
LIFVYEGDHNLYLVDNEQCDFVSAVAIDEYTGGLSDGVYDSGITRRMRGGTEHELSTVGTFVFVCTRDNHCANGQQVVVTVEPAAVQSGVCVTEAECLVDAGR